jgi:hypothetical protein
VRGGLPEQSQRRPQLDADANTVHGRCSRMT